MNEIPGRVRRRSEVTQPARYAVFDCETTGTIPGQDEIVSLALVSLDADGVEVARLATLVQPGRRIPRAATAIHGISDQDVSNAPRFVELAPALLRLLDGAIFVAHNAPFDIAMLRHALAGCRIDYRPAGVACTLAAFRLLEPLESAHGLEALCVLHSIPLEAHSALGDALAAAALLRLVLVAGLAPETVELDQSALWRLRSRGDVRPATEAQVRRVFALGRAAGLGRASLLALVTRIARTEDVDALTREGVQDVYDALEELVAARNDDRAA
jgi:DNA polymerase-3 subunit epsilon